MARAKSGSTFGQKVQWLLQARERERQEPVNANQLAAAIGIDSGTIYQWIKKGTRPRADIGRKVAQTLGVSFDVLSDETRGINQLETDRTLSALLATIPHQEQKDLSELLSRRQEREALLAWWRARRGGP